LNKKGMNYPIDLKELAYRESEQVEWKENVADINDVIQTAVAFANDYSNLGGGYIVCGAKEVKDEHGFQKMLLPGMTSQRLKEVEGKVLNACRDYVDPPIVPHTVQLPAETEDKRVLVFIIPATDHAHSFRQQSTTTYYIRIGSNTCEARNGLLRELLVKKGKLPPWDRRINLNATVNDLDLIVLREYLQRMSLWDGKRDIDEYLSPDFKLAALAPSLCQKEPLTNVLRPRNFALLLFGREPTRFFPGAVSIFSIYPGKDRGETHAERIELEGTIVEQANKLIERLNAEAYIVFDKTSTTMPNLAKYPSRALQEAVVNALAHRDYESDQPTRITIFSDRVEINSPGTLPSAIDRIKFVEGRESPFWRNQGLAYFFIKLQLAQTEGQGIPTILRTMKAEGCPAPIFEIGSENLVCILGAHPRHEAIRELRSAENDTVVGNYSAALEKVEKLLNNDPYNFRSLELYCEINNLMRTPQRVAEFIFNSKIDLFRLNAATQLVIAETLTSINNPNKSTRDIINQLLDLVGR
jgi:ATP-dependent DNA helicase RecG